MTAFNAEINVMGMGLSIPDDPKATPEIKVNLTIGQLLPLDSGDGQPLQVPLGQVSFSLNREAAEQMGQKLTEEAAKLPPTSKISVATAVDLENAKRSASAVSSMKGAND